MIELQYVHFFMRYFDFGSYSTLYYSMNTQIAGLILHNTFEN